MERILAIVSQPIRTNKKTRLSRDLIKTPQKGNTKSRDRKIIYIIGDSLLNGIAEKGLRKDHLHDHVRPVSRDKPDKSIFMTATNDLKNGVDTIKNYAKVIKTVKEASPNTSITIITVQSLKMALILSVR